MAISRHSTIRSVGTASATICRRSSTKSSIFSGSRVYKDAVAIQLDS